MRNAEIIQDVIPEGELPPAARAGRVSRPLLLLFGWTNVGIGAVGLVVPGLPTTVFLLMALWAFSKSSERFHFWLYTHPRLGPPLRDWNEHGVIPSRAKALAVSMMALSFAWVTFGVAESWELPALLAACLIPPAIFILTRPSRPRA